MPGDQIRRRTRVPPLGQISAAVDTPLKLTAGMRFHSSSVMSAVTAIGCSMPALLNAMTGRPELGGGLVEGVLYVLGAGHVAAEGKRSAAELFGSCGRFRRSHLPIDRRNRGSLPRECQRRRATDPARGTGRKVRSCPRTLRRLVGPSVWCSWLTGADYPARSIVTVKSWLWRSIASISPSNSPIRTMPLKNGASLS